MQLDANQAAMRDGAHGPARAKAMEILIALGEVFGAERLLPVTSVQVSGVSFGNLGDHGLAYLEELAATGARAVVPATLNPAGMDLERPELLSPPPGFIEKQRRVVTAYQGLGVAPTCTCTPYLSGNLPAPGDAIAWGESSAVTYANSVIGARTNREGGPSALAAALTGYTPAYGFHLDEARRPRLHVVLEAPPADPRHWGLLGRLVGELSEGQVCLLSVPGPPPGVEALKSLCAALPTYGGAPMFLLEGVSPEAERYPRPGRRVTLSARELAEAALREVEAATEAPPDLISLGCPHATLAEVRAVAERMTDRLAVRPLWISTSRGVKALADSLGLTARLEQAGVLLVTDTCFVVAPIGGRFGRLATTSAKGVYYGAGHGGMDTGLLSLEACVDLAAGEDPAEIRRAERERLEAAFPALAVGAAPGGDGHSVAEDAAAADAAPGDRRSHEPRRQPARPAAEAPARQRGRVIRAGVAEAPALVSPEPISFYGGVDLETGAIAEPGHPLEGERIGGRVLILPRGKGSTVGSWALLRLARQGVGPAAVVCAECETIVAVGAILAEIPCVDQVDPLAYATGDRVRVADGVVERISGPEAP